jgi:hypothetical protein
MTERQLKIYFNVTPDQLTWRRHYSGLYDCATVGNYVVYKDLETGRYTVTANNSVCKWRADLSKFL